MIIDSSALMAVMLHEPEADCFTALMLADPGLRMSAANWLEVAIIVDGNRDPVLRERFAELTDTFRVEVVPVSLAIAHAARRAHELYGRGRHPARLNYGDCFAYATASVLGEPLLFKGQDFSQTDIRPALPNLP